MQCSRLEDKYYSGNDADSIAVPFARYPKTYPEEWTWKLCYEACIDTQDCAAYAWKPELNPALNLCYLWSRLDTKSNGDLIDPIDSPGRTSGFCG